MASGEAGRGAVLSAPAGAGSAEPGSPSGALGLYIGVPFCRSKCSFCNFASQVFPASLYREYCELVAREIALAAQREGLAGAGVDSIYWGGGTPTLLPPGGLACIASALREHFALAPGVEHTMEAAPGTLTPAAIAAMQAAGVNRLSLGVQSFVDAEARAVGRLHRRATVLDDLVRLRAAGFDNLSLDLIAGLPRQNASSWQESLDATLASGVPHVSVYMLEVDEKSRLGRELIAGGSRYHAHDVPDEDWIADAYEVACEVLPAGGRSQYEISNFAVPGRESRHNLRYWKRAPYRGFGVDAHSLLRGAGTEVRFANPDSLEAYCEPLRRRRLPKSDPEALLPLARIEEYVFLGLRCNRGIDLARFEDAAAPVPGYAAWMRPKWETWTAEGLTRMQAGRVALTARGRLLSNRVFADCLGFAPDRVPVSLREAAAAYRSDASGGI